MKEFIQPNTDQTIIELAEGSGPFDVVYHHRQLIAKKRRRILRKANDERRKFALLQESLD